MKLKGKRFTPSMVVAMIALAVALTGTAAAGTAKLIYSSSQIKDGAIGLADISAKAKTTLKSDGLVTRHYDYVKGVRDYPGAGSGGIATVACDDDPAVSQTKVAIGGGVQFLDIGRSKGTLGNAYVGETHITDSFPGRMDWDTNTPKADRLDGWIVRLNDTPSVDMRVWVTCVDAASAS